MSNLGPNSAALMKRGADPQFGGPGTQGVFGQDVNTQGIESAKTDPNAFQWGQGAGGQQAWGYQHQGSVDQNNMTTAGNNAAQMGQNQNSLMQQQAQSMANRQGPTTDWGAAGKSAQMGLQDRSQQQQALGLQQQAAMGNAPSVAQLQMQQGQDAAIRAQQSQAASARGPAALAMAQQQAAGNTAAIQQQTAAQSAQLRAQEMAQARGDYMQGAAGMRASDLASQQQNANQAQFDTSTQLQTNQLNQQGQLASQQLGFQQANAGQQAQQQYAQMGESAKQNADQMANQVNNSQLQAGIAQQQLNSQNFNEAQNLYYQQQSQNATRDQDTGKSIMGGIGSAIGSVAGMFGLSDGNMKTNVTPAGGDSSTPGGVSPGGKPGGGGKKDNPMSGFAAAFSTPSPLMASLSDSRAKENAYMAGARDMQARAAAMAREPTQVRSTLGGAQWGVPGGAFLEAGNIDMNTRPRVHNPDGSISTVRSESSNVDGKEVLYPTVSDDGRIMSDDEAYNQYLQTGRHLGKFANPDAATAYAQELHNREAMKIDAEAMQASARAMGQEPAQVGRQGGTPDYDLGPAYDMQRSAMAMAREPAQAGSFGGMYMSDKRAKENAYVAGAMDMQRSAAAMAAEPTQVRGFQFGDDPRAYEQAAADMQASARAMAAEPAQAGQGAREREYLDYAHRMGAMSPEDLMAEGQQPQFHWGEPSQMMDRLDPYSFNYKPGTGMDPTERHYGIMAQDLERSPMGASLVRDTPQGKMVDTRKATMAGLANDAELHDRVKALEMKDAFNQPSPLASRLADEGPSFQWGY